MDKVFCIGFHKTGTTSLAAALKMLGYRVTGPNGWYNPQIAEVVYDMADELLPQFDAFQDNPWPLLYEYLDKRCPGSKFILTVRDVDAWLASQVKHFGLEHTPMRQWIYGKGCPQGNEAVYRARYEKHYADVRRYFIHRPEDLLEMDLAGGDGWDSLCPFLGVTPPSAPFPHANKASNRAWRKSPIGQLGQSLKNLLRPA